MLPSWRWNHIFRIIFHVHNITFVVCREIIALHAWSPQTNCHHTIWTKFLSTFTFGNCSRMQICRTDRTGLWASWQDWARYIEALTSHIHGQNDLTETFHLPSLHVFFDLSFEIQSETEVRNVIVTKSSKEYKKQILFMEMQKGNVWTKHC